ncbi:hypothetical protein Ocin01_13585 [Orchesella cincta]|uniref:Uncharacterized protein n=1 Tax=Orchesella cincta TaxID=48709 RepID=A0A1D2MJC9_ORCCI|nr:hypothetical protein Ocin01_13585 [Orchesella cincta]
MKGQYTCIIVLLSVSSLVFAEPPLNGGGKPVVSQRLLNRVADIIANGGDASSRDDGRQTNEGSSVVDQELLNRIARIIGQNDAQLSWAHKKHSSSESGHPSRSLSLPKGSEEQVGYGVPPKEVPPNAGELAGEQYELSPPQPVPRIASFDVTDDDESSFGGYSTSGQLNQDTYADNSNLYQGNGKIQLGSPENAVRIASFDIAGEQPPAPYSPPQARNSGYHNRR